MKNILTIVRKELRAYFNNPTAYIIIVAFLLLWEFLFFRSVFLIGESSLRGLFDLLPWIFLVVIPAITMGSLAEEKSDGTLEFLLTHPIKQMQLIVGKFLGSLAFIAITLLFIFPLGWSLNQYGNLDWGTTFSQYIASVLLSGVLISLGVCISGFFSSQISALMVSAVAGFFLTIAGTEMVTARLPLQLAPFFEQLSLMTHYESMVRGVIDLRNLWYFVSFSAVFLALAYLNLLKNKFGNRKSAYRTYQTAFALMVGIAVLSNIVGARIPGRIDMTEEKLYTLSKATRDTVANLPDLVNISLYASDKLPAQLQPVLRETKDILEDYQTASKGNIRVEYKNPSSDPSIAREAATNGIQQIRFNVVSQEEFQVKDGFLGLTVAYGDKHESIAYIENVTTLEYQLSSFIKKLTAENKSKVAFLSGHGEKSLMRDFQLLGKELDKQFETEEITPKAKEPEQKKTDTKADPKKTATPPPAEEKELTITEGTKVLVVAGPSQDLAEQEKNQIAAFIEKGGNVLFLLDGISISPQTMAATPNEKNLADYVKSLTGVEVKKDMIYDLHSNETVGFGGGPMQYLLPYPLWLRAVKAEGGSPVTSKIESIVMPWASSLEVDENALKDKGYNRIDLFTTSPQAGTLSGKFNLAPDQKFSQSGLSKKTVALALTPAKDSGSRIIIISDSDILSDQYVQDSPANLSFGIEAISWLSQEQSLAEINMKNLVERKLVLESESQPTVIKFGNLAFAFLSTAGYGAWRLTRRKNMKKLSYGE